MIIFSSLQSYALDGSALDWLMVILGRSTSLLSCFLPNFNTRNMPFHCAYSLLIRVFSRFLGTPFFHSMLEKSRLFTTDIAVFVDPQTVLLPDLISTLNYAYKLDRDWLLVASLRNVSYFPFHLDDAGEHWLRALSHLR